MELGGGNQPGNFRFIEGDSGNQFEVVPKAGGQVLRVTYPFPYRFTKAEALNLAAWLRVIADPDGKEFERLAKEIQTK
jgi:hypothetical protein